MSIHWDWSGERIEQESFRLIHDECKNAVASLPEAEWRIVRRIVHTTGDPLLVDLIHCKHDPIASAKSALRSGAPIICDTKMVRAGISLARLRKINPNYDQNDLYCFIDDPDVVAQAKREGCARSLCAAEKAKPLLDGSLVLIGNAPLALARIAKYALEEKVSPALVIGMPVGFVNVVESKELLAQTSLPYILLEGRRGGSTLAVAALHAILEIV